MLINFNKEWIIKRKQCKTTTNQNVTWKFKRNLSFKYGLTHCGQCGVHGRWDCWQTRGMDWKQRQTDEQRLTCGPGSPCCPGGPGSPCGPWTWQEKKCSQLLHEHTYIYMYTSFYPNILLFFKHGPCSQLTRRRKPSMVKWCLDKVRIRSILCAGSAICSLIKLFLLKMYKNCKTRIQVTMAAWLTNSVSWRSCFVATQPSGCGLRLIRLTGMVGCFVSPLRFSVSQDKHTHKQSRALWNNLPQLLKQTANTMLDTVSSHWLLAALQWEVRHPPNSQ